MKISVRESTLALGTFCGPSAPGTKGRTEQQSLRIQVLHGAARVLPLLARRPGTGSTRLAPLLLQLPSRLPGGSTAGG